VSARARTEAATRTPSHPHHSITLVVGQLPHDPQRRELPSGSVVLSFDLSVRADDRPGESVPVAWADPPARPTLKAGDEVLVVGRTRRRFFRAGGATASRTEVVAERVVTVRQRARWAAAVAETGEQLAEIGGDEG
jgi:single-strand DNA-binding protein